MSENDIFGEGTSSSSTSRFHSKRVIGALTAIAVASLLFGGLYASGAFSSNTTGHVSISTSTSTTTTHIAPTSAFIVSASIISSTTSTACHVGTNGLSVSCDNSTLTEVTFVGNASSGLQPTFSSEQLTIIVGNNGTSTINPIVTPTVTVGTGITITQTSTTSPIPAGGQESFIFAIDGQAGTNESSFNVGITG